MPLPQLPTNDPISSTPMDESLAGIIRRTIDAIKFNNLDAVNRPNQSLLIISVKVVREVSQSIELR